MIQNYFVYYYFINSASCNINIKHKLSQSSGQVNKKFNTSKYRWTVWIILQTKSLQLIAAQNMWFNYQEKSGLEICVIHYPTVRGIANSTYLKEEMKKQEDSSTLGINLLLTKVLNFPINYILSNFVF